MSSEKLSGYCVNCNSVQLIYENVRHISEGIVFPYKCQECGHMGGEIYKATFQSMY